MATQSTAGPGRGNRLFFATADRRGARLFEGLLTEHGRVHVEEREALSELWEELQHSRPSPRSGKDGHSYASVGHEEEERVHRFAKALSRWLEEQLREHRIRRLHVFLARDLLGEYRGVASGAFAERVEAHALNLAQLESAELAKHRAVADLVRNALEVAAPTPDRGRAEVVQTMADGGPLAPWLATEHAALRELIDRLRAEIDRLRGEPGSHAAGELPELLADFRDHLRSHFELEEQAGFLAPGSPAAETLLPQHRDLEQRLDRALDAVRRAMESGDDLSDAFVDGLRDFLEQLAEHESAENAVVGQEHP